MSTRPRITIVGLGRIGASLGLALKKANPDLQVIGHDKDPRVGPIAQKRGAVDKSEWNLLNACDGAGMIILALPLSAIQDTLKVLSGEVAQGVVITDTASTKVPVLEWAAALPAGVHFVGGDPIIPPSAGGDREASGVQVADANLFQDAVYCLTPAVNASEKAVQVVSTLVSLVGAKPLFLDASEHDGLITGAQHLPYLLAATLLYATTTSSGWRDMSKLAGRDFMDATALAARDPESQRALLLHHRQDLMRWIDITIDTLADLRGALEREDAERIDAVLSDLVDARATWLAGRGEPVLNTADLVPSFSRMLLGGLATPRGGKKR